MQRRQGRKVSERSLSKNGHKEGLPCLNYVVVSFLQPKDDPNANSLFLRVRDE
jgi:hypothetical protein